MDTPAFAVVGMGGFAKQHLRYVQEVEEAGLGRHVAQVAIPSDLELFAAEVAQLRKRGVEVYASLREMLADARERIDVTCIPTGTPLHRSMTVAALEAGTNVLVEKPAAGSIQDVDAMIRARDAAGKLCAVGFQHIYRLDTQQLKAWVCEGRFGETRGVKSFGCWPRNEAYYQRNGWAARLAVGDTWVLDSPHNNALAHAVNAMCYVACNRPGESLTPVSAQAELYRANPIESAGPCAFRARTVEGAEVFFASQGNRTKCVQHQRDALNGLLERDRSCRRAAGGATRLARAATRPARSLECRRHRVQSPSCDCPGSSANSSAHWRLLMPRGMKASPRSCPIGRISRIGLSSAHCRGRPIPGRAGKLRRSTSSQRSAR